MREHGGVRRFASEVSVHLPTTCVLQPRSAKYPWSGRVWEQTRLLRASAEGVLLSMAHSGPLRHRRHVVVIHDLLALSDPGSVHPAYALLLRRQLPQLVGRAAMVATVSAHVADQVAATFALATSRIEVVPPGISDVFRHASPGAAHGRLRLDRERPVVAALLDPTPRKNRPQLEELLRSVATDRPDAQIVVAGRATPAAFGRSWRQANRQRHPQPGFLDLGAAADIELAAMYHAADVFVSLTAGEGFGLPAVEAAYSGAAVVTTPVPSMTEHGPHSALIVNSPAEAHCAVMTLLDDAGRRKELSAAAQEQLGDLQWSQSAARLEAMMNGLDAK